MNMIELPVLDTRKLKNMVRLHKLSCAALIGIALYLALATSGQWFAIVIGALITISYSNAEASREHKRLEAEQHAAIQKHLIKTGVLNDRGSLDFLPDHNDRRIPTDKQHKP